MGNPSEHTDAVFERIWKNFNLDKAKLRSLSEKDKSELRELMRTIFMSSLEAGKVIQEATAAAQEISLNFSGHSKEEVENTVRGVVKEELAEMMDVLRDIKDTKSTQTVYVSGQAPRGVGGIEEDEAVIALHGSMFDSDMKTNIDDVTVEGKEVGGVSSSLDALRKLNKKD
jgi:hypothetical protein